MPREASGARPRVRPNDIEESQRPALRRYRSWQRFHSGPRQSGRPLLDRLQRYPNAVLVAGCQRSGTTMLTRIIARSAGLRGLALTDDDELDAALTLCGEVDLPAGERYCFQTTYLNSHYPEYRGMGSGHRLVWVLRNPNSVVYSMVYNWRRFAFNELYDELGSTLATTEQRRRLGRFWAFGSARVEKACLSYSAKIAQIKEILKIVPREQILVVDYDELVKAPGDWLPKIFAFIGEPYDMAYGSAVRGDSLKKARGLSRRERELVAQLAEPTFQRCLRLVDGLGR